MHHHIQQKIALLGAQHTLVKGALAASTLALLVVCRLEPQANMCSVKVRLELLE
jgi:hypothetical protein